MFVSVHLLSPDEIYIQLEEDFDYYKHLQAEIDGYCGNEHLQAPVIGAVNKYEFVFVYSDTLNRWCRARYLDITKKFEYREREAHVYDDPILREYTALAGPTADSTHRSRHGLVRHRGPVRLRVS